MRILLRTPGRILRGVFFASARGVACLAAFSMLCGLLFPAVAGARLDRVALEEALAGQKDLLYVFSFSSLPVAVMNGLIGRAYPLPDSKGADKKPLPEKQDERAMPSAALPLLIAARHDVMKAALQPGGWGTNTAPSPLSGCAGPPGGPPGAYPAPVPAGQAAAVLLTAFFFLFLLPRSSLAEEGDRIVLRRS